MGFFSIEPFSGYLIMKVTPTFAHEYNESLLINKVFADHGI